MKLFVEGNELSASVRIARMLDVTTIFTLDLATRVPPTDSAGRVTHSFCSHTEAREALQALPVGAVGIQVGASRAEAFIKNVMAFDRISQSRSGEWAVCTDWGAKAFVEDDNVDIFEAAIPQYYLNDPSPGGKVLSTFITTTYVATPLTNSTAAHFVKKTLASTIVLAAQWIERPAYVITFITSDFNTVDGGSYCALGQ